MEGNALGDIADELVNVNDSKSHVDFCYLFHIDVKKTAELGSNCQADHAGDHMLGDLVWRNLNGKCDKCHE